MPQKLATLLAGLISFFGAAQPFDGTVWNNPHQDLPPGVTHQTLHSEAMKTDVGFNIYLPPDYAADPKRRYPVVYFLHGRGGDENAGMDNFASHLKSNPPPQMIVVFPNGGKNSKYLDAAPGSSMHGVMMIETMIVRELAPYIERVYRADARREARFVEGFSMGGMGALRLAFKHPDVFGAVYAIAPALDDTGETIGAEEPDLLRNMLNSRPQSWTDEMARTQLRLNASAIRDSELRVGLSIGADDELLPWTKEIAGDLESQRIPYDLEIVPSRGHSYVFGPNFTFAQQAAAR